MESGKGGKWDWGLRISFLPEWESRKQWTWNSGWKWCMYSSLLFIVCLPVTVVFDQSYLFLLFVVSKLWFNLFLFATYHQFFFATNRCVESTAPRYPYRRKVFNFYFIFPLVQGIFFTNRIEIWFFIILRCRQPNCKGWYTKLAKYIKQHMYFWEILRLSCDVTKQLLTSIRTNLAFSKTVNYHYPLSFILHKDE